MRFWVDPGSLVGVGVVTANTACLGGGVCELGEPTFDFPPLIGSSWRARHFGCRPAGVRADGPPGKDVVFTIAGSDGSGGPLSGDMCFYVAPGSGRRVAPVVVRPGIAGLTTQPQIGLGSSYEGTIAASYERVMRIGTTGTGGA